MRVSKKDMSLYVVTTSEYLKEKTLAEECEEILKSGASFLQLREKNMPYKDLLELGKSIKNIANKYNVPFVINDNVKLALELDVDGVHVGQDDMDALEVRKLLDNKILGVSVQTLDQAIQAEKDGADYLGIGPIFTTNTKPDAEVLDIKEVQKIIEAVKIPTVLIGGIDDETIEEIKDINTDGVAVVSYIFASENKSYKTRKLRELSDEFFK